MRKKATQVTAPKTWVGAMDLWEEKMVGKANPGDLGEELLKKMMHASFQDYGKHMAKCSCRKRETRRKKN